MTSSPRSAEDIIGREPLPSEPAMTPQQAKLSTQGGFSLYRELAVGNGSLLDLLRYEFSLLALSNMPGLLGYGLRSLLYPGLFRSCGAKPAFGRGVVLRNVRQVSVGKRLLLDEYGGIDVRGPHSSVTIGDHVSIGRFSSIVARKGSIILHDGVNIGAYTRIGTESKVEIGASTLIAGYCYIGPGNHQPASDGTPLIAREMDIRGGVTIGKHVWLGTRTTVIDGVTIGDEAIIGAHSLVRDDVPPRAIAFGTPAKVVRYLDE